MLAIFRKISGISFCQYLETGGFRWYCGLMKPKTISREHAGAICRERLLEIESGEPLSTLSQFMAQLVDGGLLARPVSPPTLWRVLSGRYYRNLVDPISGNPIDFKQISGHRGTRLTAGATSLRLDQLEREVRALRRAIEDLELGTKSVELLPTVSTPPAPRAVAVVPSSFEAYCEQRGFTPSYRKPENVGITPRSPA